MVDFPRDESLAAVLAAYRADVDAILAGGPPPKLGRWFHCKNCYKSVLPVIGPDGTIVVCSECEFGLAPYDDVCRFGSLMAWYAFICEEFHSRFSSPG